MVLENGGSPESAGVKEKIKEILNVALRDPRRDYGHGLKLLFYGEPNVMWIPTDYPPKMERVWRYPYVVCVSILPMGGRLKVEISESVSFFEGWREAFDYVAEKVAELCNYSITKVEIIYVANDTIWRRDPPKEV